MRRSGTLRSSLPVAATALVALACIAILKLDQLRLPLTKLPARTEGTFTAEGPTPHGKPPTDHVAFWSSWGGADPNKGTLTIGPFPAPARLGLYLSGYLQVEGNAITVRHLASGEERRQNVFNIGERWQPVMLGIPQAWSGDEIEIVAQDNATDLGGWMAIGMPFTRPSWTEWIHGLVQRFAVLGIVLATIATFSAAAGRLLIAGGWISRNSSLLLPAGVSAIALIGYALFFIGIPSSTACTALAWLALGLSASIILVPLVARRKGRPAGPQDIDADTHESAPDGSRPPTNPPRQDGGAEWPWMVVTTLVCAVFVFSMLHAFDDHTPMSDLAQRRFLDQQLPGDNIIPQYIAHRVLFQEPVNAIFLDWHSSDRPPLQTGWILAVTQPALVLGADFDTASQCAGFCFQLIAVMAMWVLLRSLGATRFAAVAIIFAIVTAGFFLINLAFTWPKMGSGGFAVLAFVIWFTPTRELAVRVRHVLAGTMAGLAWLSHEGAAFALLAAVPFAIATLPRTGWRAWLLASLAFLTLALPWTAYQKFYDPPGNRLLKWHLAGVVPVDSRGTLETLVDTYRGCSFGQWLQGRRKNLHTISAGPWSDLLSFSYVHQDPRRDAEFYLMVFALGWWNLGLAAWPVALWRWRRDPAPHRWAGALFLWTLATVALWTVLMFTGGQTVIHQGSYTTLLVLFPLLAWMLWRAPPLLFAAVALAQGVSLVALWLHVPAGAASSTLLPAPLVLVVAFVLATALLIVVAIRREGLRRPGIVTRHAETRS